MNEQENTSQVSATSMERRKATLGDTVRTTLKLYLDALDGRDPGPLYEMVITEVERPLFEAVMEYTDGNKSRAAKILGISRSNIMQKLKLYNLFES